MRMKTQLQRPCTASKRYQTIKILWDTVECNYRLAWWELCMWFRLFFYTLLLRHMNMAPSSSRSSVSPPGTYNRS